MGQDSIVAVLHARMVEELKLKGHASDKHTALWTTFGAAKAWLNTHESQLQTTNADEEYQQGDEAARVNGALMYLARLIHQVEEKAPASSFGMPLSSIASAAATNLVHMLKELDVVKSKLAPFLAERNLSSEQLESVGNIPQWQQITLYMTLMSKKYKTFFDRYLHGIPDNKALAMRMGWLLYLVLKTKLLPAFPDVISCMELLICVTTVMVAHLPDLPADIARGPGGQVDLLDAIAGPLKADLGRVKQLMLSVNAVFTHELQTHSKDWLMGSKATQHPDAPLVQTSCAYVPELLTDASRLKAISDGLDREYHAYFQKHGEVDERELLYTDLTQFASPRMTPRTAYQQPSLPGLSGIPHDAHACVILTPTDQSGKVQLLKGSTNTSSTKLGPGSFTTAPSSTPSVINGLVAQHQMANQSLPIGMQSPMPITQLAHSAATPITEALGSTAWLRNVLASLKPGPSPNLQKYFAACVPNPAATIAKRVKEMTEAVLPNEHQAMTAFPMAHPSLAAYRREEAIKLYYHVLELILVSEERLAANAAANAGVAMTAQPAVPCYTTLLTSSKLHKGLMACSLELVMACYRIVSCPFPKILDVIKLHAFDLIKIVQTYVRHMPGMPLELKRHLYLMEEKTVEFLAWQEGSSLYPVVITAMGNTGATSSPATQANAAAAAVLESVSKSNQHTTVSEQNAEEQHGQQQPMQTDCAVAVDPSPSKRYAAAAHSMMSPLKKARGADSHAITTQGAPQLSDPLPAAIGKPPIASLLAGLHPETAAALTWLHDFMRKVLKLAWFRLGFMCQSLNFGPQDPAIVRHKVYEIVEHAVYMHTNLLYNRHLDQLLLSALYGYCKVQHMGGITFKEIIAQYRRQPQASQSVFRSVVLSQTNPGLAVQSRGDIIAFYNQCFVPLMKQYLLRGDASSPSNLGLPPIPPSSAGLPAHIPRPPGAGSPRTFPSPVGNVGSPKMHASPGILSMAGTSPVGKPPLPPNPSEAVVLHTHIKQTIHGFFPPVGSRNCSGIPGSRPGVQQPSPLGPNQAGGFIQPKQPGSAGSSPVFFPQKTPSSSPIFSSPQMPKWGMQTMPGSAPPKPSILGMGTKSSILSNIPFAVPRTAINPPTSAVAEAHQPASQEQGMTAGLPKAVDTVLVVSVTNTSGDEAPLGSGRTADSGTEDRNGSSATVEMQQDDETHQLLSPPSTSSVRRQNSESGTGNAGLSEGNASPEAMSNISSTGASVLTHGLVNI